MQALDFRPKGKPVPVTVSIGVADAADLGPPKAATAELLLQRADAALYLAKDSGRNRVVRA